MKTKFVKSLSMFWVAVMLLGLAIAIVKGEALLGIPFVVMLVTFMLVVIIASIFLNRFVIRILLQDFRRQMQANVDEKYLYADKTFPSKQDIDVWFSKHSSTIKGSYANSCWSNVSDDTKYFQQWVSIIKEISVPIIGVYHGISLFELYYLKSIDLSDIDSADTVDELEKTIAFAQFMLLDDLMQYLRSPISLSKKSLYHLMVRENGIGDFNDLCAELMESDKKVLAPMDVVEELISDTNAQNPIKFPKEFLAYLIKQEAENNHGFPIDPEKRKKVFDWYTSQKKQDIDRNFSFHWPKFTKEEIPVIFKLFDEKVVRDQIFFQNKSWEYVPTNQLIPMLYSQYGLPDDDFTKEIVKRL